MREDRTLQSHPMNGIRHRLKEEQREERLAHSQVAWVNNGEVRVLAVGGALVWAGRARGGAGHQGVVEGLGRTLGLHSHQAAASPEGRGALGCGLPSPTGSSQVSVLAHEDVVVPVLTLGAEAGRHLHMRDGKGRLRLFLVRGKILPAHSKSSLDSAGDKGARCKQPKSRCVTALTRIRVPALSVVSLLLVVNAGVVGPQSSFSGGHGGVVIVSDGDHLVLLGLQLALVEAQRSLKDVLDLPGSGITHGRLLTDSFLPMVLLWERERVMLKNDSFLVAERGGDEVPTSLPLKGGRGGEAVD
ncbi:hypothetical protein EYF80_017634 [Liparis tanakae]|uniref:Uncharacterized protein n=1 Tax=Liparis tanakae TaxID=230148 RepID=A0A4Z2I2A7_9TELE|nr:hypothetical protein EYF80_017634 [Liparis tanakae]